MAHLEQEMGDVLRLLKVTGHILSIRYRNQLWSVTATAADFTSFSSEDHRLSTALNTVLVQLRKDAANG